MNKNIQMLTGGGKKTVWNADFTAQTWAETMDIYGGYGGWSAGSGYNPRRNYGGNGIIQWQSTTNWYYGWILDHWVEPSTAKMKGILAEGTCFGYMGTSYHTQTTSYNFFCSDIGCGADNTSTYPHARNITGLSFTAWSGGNYYGSYFAFNVYCGNVFLGTLTTIGGNSMYYTIRFKLQGKKLYALATSGDTRASTDVLPLFSTAVDKTALAGDKTVIYMSSWITNDQGESCYGQVNSINLVTHV